MTDDPAYRLGFLCRVRQDIASSPEVVSSWQSIRLADVDVFIEPDAAIQTVETVAGERAVAIGDIFVAHGPQQLDALLLRIAAGDREPLEDLSGRFAIILERRGQVSIVHDPLGSQSVFYSTDGALAGSHAALLAEVCGVQQSQRVRRYMAMPEYKSRNTRFLPGDLTLFDNILLLAPNNELYLGSATTSRYWPARPVRNTAADEAFAVWDEYFSNYARFLTPRYRPVLGLTGGTDSRSIIATLRHKGMQLRCETWDSMPAPERARIEPMVEHLGVDHRWLDLTERADTARFRELRLAAKKAAGFTRGTPILPALMDHTADTRDIFLYGHGSGVMRGSYSRQFKAWLPEDPLKRHYALYAGSLRKTASKGYENFTLEALEGFLQRANYGTELFGTDIGDLFYWEQRMANWAALQIATFAVTMQSHAALNSRRLFSTFWGIDGEARSAKRLNMDIMRRYDPVLAEL